MHPFVATLFVSAALVAGAKAEAQPVTEGSRVRLTAASSGLTHVVGTLAATDETSLTIFVEGRASKVFWSDVTRLELSLGPSHRGRNATRGALIGGVVGGIAGYAAGSDCSAGEWLCFSHESTAAGGVILFAPLGALIGAMTGGERWQVVESSAVHVAAKPIAVRGRGAGVQLTIGF